MFLKDFFRKVVCFEINYISLNSSFATLYKHIINESWFFHLPFKELMCKHVDSEEKLELHNFLRETPLTFGKIFLSSPSHVFKFLDIKIP